MRRESETKLMDGCAAAFANVNLATEYKPAGSEKKLSPQQPERDEPTLGDLNPLIHGIDFNSSIPELIANVTKEKITKHKGRIPDFIGSMMVFSQSKKANLPRFIARFEVDQLTEEQLVLLEETVRDTYKGPVRTRKTQDGAPVDPKNERYPSINKEDERYVNSNGWYMGLDGFPTDSGHQGLFVYKDLGKITNDNFTSQDHRSAGKYIVEIREGSLFQTDLVNFTTQVAVILNNQKTPDKGELIYETYYELLRKNIDTNELNSLHGLDEQEEKIRRRLLIPLTSPDLSKGIGQSPESVLMAGVPGTGKTHLVKKLIGQDTGTFIIPITPVRMLEELMAPSEKKELFPRIAQISKDTKKPVILHIDDIEEIASEESPQANFLNLMAGVKKQGFHIVASTNKPEAIHPSLLQPQRFGVLIYTGLQDEPARKSILDIHATPKSKRLNEPLFGSDFERDLILSEVARLTEAFTPRYLAQIATAAKANLLRRVSRLKSREIGLKEEDLAGNKFEAEDWEKALGEIARQYDKKDVTQRDKEIREFIEKAEQQQAGFNTRSEETSVFSRDVYDRISASRNPLI